MPKQLISVDLPAELLGRLDKVVAARKLSGFKPSLVTTDIRRRRGFSPLTTTSRTQLIVELLEAALPKVE